ncbi:glycosyltransferase family 9 protein [Phascolarctobacterium faecium]|uniref:glycosyltransferase family 9 protein n=1 Tax=Phascolarctobacterium faecium TaxID=33025 RepID=UPI00243115CE|nr:glycosyltransferase family 9 protein [Phascolarctobacterium faecium]
MKILIDSKHGLGDCVQIIPMLQIIRDNYPDCYLAVIVRNKASRELLQAASVTIDEYYYLDMQTITIKKLLALIVSLRHQVFDYFIISPISTKWKAIIFALLTGAKRCIGEQYQKMDKYQIDNTVHMVERNLNLLRCICKIPDQKINPELKVDKNSFTSIIKQDGIKIIGICIGGGTAVVINHERIYPRKWSIEKIKLVIKNVLDYGYKVVLFGGQDEIKELEHLSNILGHQNLYDFVGKTDIKESIILAAQCDLLIGVDTGMQHIADAVKTKTISLFGPTNPLTHGAYSDKAVFIEADCKCEYKYCYGTNMYWQCKDRKCLNDISAEHVINKMLQEKVWK